MSGNQYIKRHHHLTLSVGNGQEDYDFHTQVLGLKSVKKTALYDGDEPILHLYYGNDTGDPGRLITCFPMKHSGRKARKGTGQVGSISLAVPETALGYWEKRLREHRFDVKVSERFGERFVQFHHPCGIEYELVGAKGDKRAPYSTGKDVPIEHGIKGTHGICVSIRDAQNSDEFMQVGWNGKNRQTDGKYIRYEVGDGGSGAYVEFRVEPDLPAGSWTYGEGVPHHVAFEVDNHDVQSKVKFHLEGIGFTDVSEMKDRGYFDSVYVRTPGGALFEATVTKPQGFLVDEPYEKLGTSMQIPPFFASRREELLEKIEPLRY
ncbi:MAG TPA: hydroxyquinol 1,2-dioxygenase [Steroidobacteraceae bacterium]